MNSAMSQPNLAPSNKSASRIREMLESVRGRMAAVVSQSSVSSTTPDPNTGSKIPIKKTTMTKNGVNKSGNRQTLTKTTNGGQIQSSRAEDKEFLMNLFRTLEDIESNAEFLKQKLTNDFLTTKELMAEYLSSDPTKLNFHDCLCNILTFSRYLKEVTEGDNCQKSLNISKEGSALKRSSTISSRPPSKIATRRVTGERKSIGASGIKNSYDENRTSFGGYRPSDRRQSSFVNSSTCSSIIKSSMSSLSSQASSTRRFSGKLIDL